MKKFMMIFTGTDYATLGLSPEELQNRMGKWFTWGNKMKEAGILHDGHALTPQIRKISGENRTAKDLTSAELKEIIGGYYLIDAKDFDDVERVAKDYPDYDLGGVVEIREIMVFNR